MLKKSLIVVAALTILAMAVMPAIADEPSQDTEDVKKKIDTKLKLKSAGWPVEFAWVNLEGFKIPVYMMVELYMEILNMQEVIDAGIMLEQVSMSKYDGCSIPIQIKSNFDLELGAKETIVKIGDKTIMDAEKDILEIRDDKCEDKAAFVPKTLCDSAAKRTVYFKIKNVKLVHHDWGKKVKVADIQVRVKPAIEYAQWTIACDP
ncbi:MAG: hypothetical protein ACETVZ_06920 [Phycisphaerae bacterium]